MSNQSAHRDCEIQCIYREQYSTLDWQKDDIEYAIDEYTHTMNGDLYAFLSDGKNDFLRDHTHFASDIISAIERMEKMLE